MKTLVDEKLEVVTYSSTEYFTTNEPQAASLSSLSYNNVTLFTIDVTAEMTSVGDGTVVEKGFCWANTVDLYYWSNVTLENADGSLVVADDEGTGTTFQATLTGLEPATQYRVVAYIITELKGVKYTAYSSSSNITTSSPQLPTLDYPTISDITYNSAKFTNRMNSEGNYEITEAGVVISSTTSSPDIYTNEFKAQYGEDGACTITGLTDDTYYYCRNYAICTLNGQTEVVYTGYTSFRSSSVSYPILSAPSADNVSFTSADLGFVLQSSGNYEVTKRGICVSTKTSEPSVTNNEYMKELGEDETVYSLTNLTPKKTYYARSYVVCVLDNDESTTTTRYSATTQFTTSQIAGATFNSMSTGTSTWTTILASASIGELGDGELAEHGFIWRKYSYGANLTVDDCEGLLKVEGSDKDYSATLTDLLPGTSYYIRAYVKTLLQGIETITYSDKQNSYTSSYSVTNTTSATSNTTELITFTYSNEMIDQAEECGVVYSTEAVEATEMTLSKVATVSASDSKTFTVTLENLTQNTKYYYCVYTKLKGGVVYTGREYFTTKAIPTIDDNVSPSKKD
jgi:hypothetical protein